MAERYGGVYGGTYAKVSSIILESLLCDTNLT